MNRRRTGGWMRCLGAGSALLFAAGCLSPQFAWLNPDRVRMPEYPFAFEDAAKKRQDVVLAVFVAADPGTETLVPGAEATLSNDLARLMPELAKEAWSNPRLTILDTVVVDKFKLKTPSWKLMFASDCGKQLGADFVLVVHLNRVSLYQPGSQERVYEGHADVTVDVFDVAAGSVGPKYRYELRVQYPHSAAFDASNLQVTRFRKEFLDRVATEIAIKHVAHRRAYEAGEEGR